MRSRRLPVLLVVIGLVAALVALDRDTAAEGGDEATVVRTGTVPMSDPADALSSTWYCASGTAAEGGEADLTVIVVNLRDDPVSGRVRWVPNEDGDPAVTPVLIGPRATTAYRARDVITAPRVSAVVEVTGGGVVVDHRVEGDRGTSRAPCASSASDRWYLANGATTRDASQRLALFNPFADDAVVDITVSTGAALEEPPDLQGLPVPGRRTITVDLGDAARRRETTSAAIVARIGRLVVDRVQTFDGSEGREDLALTLAAPYLAEVWSFPDGPRPDGPTERWHVFNPAETEAIVAVEVVPDQGPPVEPVELTVPPRGRVTYDAAQVGLAPDSGGHSSTVRSRNDVEVVAERELASDAGGWSSLVGVQLPAERWLLAAGDVAVIHNPGNVAVTVTVRAVDSEGGGTEVDVGPAARRRVDLPGRGGEPRPSIVEASGDVTVEQVLDSGADRSVPAIVR